MLSVLPPILVILALLVVFINSVCILIDTLMIRNHKSALYYRLLDIWNNIDDSKLVDYPRFAAKLTLKLKSVIFGSKSISFRSTLTTIIFSIFLTTVALSAHRVISGAISIIDIREIFNFQRVFHRNQMYMPSLYLTNLVYDTLTIAVTTYVLKLIIQKGNASKRMLLLCADAVFAFLLAVLCLYTTIQISIHFNHVWVSTNMKPHLLSEMEVQIEAIKNSGGIILHVFGDLTSTIKALLTFGSKGNTYTTMSLASATTLVPTIVYINILILLVITKAVVRFSQSGAKYVIEKATEPDIDSANQADKFMPFTILGRIISVFSAFVVFVVVVLRL